MQVPESLIRPTLEVVAPETVSGPVNWPSVSILTGTRECPVAVAPAGAAAATTQPMTSMQRIASVLSLWVPRHGALPSRGATVRLVPAVSSMMSGSWP